MQDICGVYRWKNIVNGKSYIGSSARIFARQQDHLNELRSDRHSNPHLQASWNLYGEKAFQFEILIVCSEDNLLFQEQYAIDAFDAVRTGYNIALIAGRPMAGRKHTVETKRKMADSHRGHQVSESTKRAISDAKRGIEFSDLHKRALSDARKGMKLSEEHRKHISLAGLKVREKHSKVGVETWGNSSPEYKSWLVRKAAASRWGNPFSEAKPVRIIPKSLEAHRATC